MNSKLSGIIILVAMATTCYCHVSLTYPPARKYPLDFLDVIRTPPPCGMPKGKELFWFSSFLGPVVECLRVLKRHLLTKNVLQLHTSLKLWQIMDSSLVSIQCKINYSSSFHYKLLLQCMPKVLSLRCRDIFVLWFSCLRGKRSLVCYRLEKQCVHLTFDFM